MKRKVLRIGIVGCGAIGSSLARVITRDFKKEARLSQVFDIDTEKARGLSRKISGSQKLSAATLRKLVSGSDLVIESASAKVSLDIARLALGAGRDVMVMSVAGISGHLEQLTRLAGSRGSRLYIPSGAISGIDALKAAKLGKVYKVTLTTTKNPMSFKGVAYLAQKNIAPEKIKKDTVLFSGQAKRAVKYFPQNINVAAVLSLAGIGAAKTQVRIVASPKVTRNIHEISIESGAGNIFTRTENILHPDNPKTSYLAVLSAVAALKQILEPVRIGT